MQTFTEEGTIADRVADNDLQLAELSHFLSAVTPDVYAQANGEDAEIGQHVRYILHHCACLLGATEGRVDYTRRAREELIGCCPRATNPGELACGCRLT